MSIIVDRILKLINETNTTKAQVEKSCGIGNGTIGKWQKGLNNPSYGHLSKIAKYFDVSLEYLEGKTDIKNATAITEQLQSETLFLSKDEINIIELYRNLNSEGQEKVRDYISDIVAGGRYKKYDALGMAQKA